MRALISAFVLAVMTGVAGAEGYVPEKRILISRDVDLAGTDLSSMFDTTFEACRNACLANTSCEAFTFNSRSNSCFPKTGITGQSDYVGAISAEILPTPDFMLKTADKRADELNFLSTRDLTQARKFAETMGERHSAQGWKINDLINEARAARTGGDPLRALRLMGAAITVTDAPDLWIEFARMAEGIQTKDNGQRREFRRQALLAATNGYLRSERDPARVSALAVLAQALEENGRGKDMIPALRLADSIQPRDEVTALLDNAIGKYGFRVTETSVDSDAARPRACVVFNERLVQAGVDYAPFVQRPEEGLVVDVSDRQLCVDGVKHGERYRLTFRAGLPAESGEELIKPYTATLYVRDRSPAAKFPGRSYVLPAAGEIALPIETVNVDTLEMRLLKVSDRNLLRAIQSDYFGRPLAPWQAENFGADIAVEVWKGTAQTANELNRDMTTRLPLDEIMGALPTGIYALEAIIPGVDLYETPAAMQWFVISDIGLATLSGADGLHVFARSLGTTAAMAGQKVTLLSRANDVLGTAVTDAEGHATFEVGLTRGQGGAAPALVTVEGDNDIAFLSLKDPAFDLSDRGVEGREPAGPVDLFLTTDRGAYRAGETIHMTALARDSTSTALNGLPITAVLTRPDGVEYARQFSQGAGAGGHVLSFPLSTSVPRGTWRLALFSDPDAPALKAQTLLVEDFLPERIDFALDLPEGPLSPADRPPLKIDADYLFGAPAAELPIDADVLVKAKSSLAGFPGYSFGRYDARPETGFDYLKSGVRTDAEGNATLAVNFPKAKAEGRPLEARIRVRVTEGSGRPVERLINTDLLPATPLIGVKAQFDGVVAEGSDASFQLIALNPDLTPRDMKVTWTVNRVERRYQWYQLYGNWNWDPVTIRSRVASGEATLGGEPVTVTAPVDWGGYEIVVEAVGGTYVSSSAEFYAGWYAPVDASSTPDTLEVSLDKESYLPGETAKLRIDPRYDGTAMITVMSNRLIDMKAVPVSGETVVELPVTDDWGAGAYVTATLLKPMEADQGRNPARALGLTHADVDPGARALDVTLDVAETSLPRGPLDVIVNVAGVKAGETAYVTVAAVDLGILNLTGFESPDPSGHYFGQRKLGMEIRDIYGRLIDGLNGAMGQVRSGGDASDGMRLQSPPPTEELVAYFSGAVEVGADGTAAITFDIPEFNGTARLMAVAWSASGVGEAEADVLVRDPIVLSASLPRYLAPGDESRMLLEIVHATGPAGRVGLDVTAEGVTLDSRSVPAGFDIVDLGKQVFSIPITAGDVGDHSVTVAMTTPGGAVLTKTLTLPVRVNDPEVSQTRRFTLNDQGTFTFGRDVFAEMRPGTGSATLALGPLARLDAPGLLLALDRYPYGCTEQTTSRAMPLLYMDQVAVAMGLGTRDDLKTRIEGAIERVLTRQSSNGSFGLWSPGSGDFWLDAYVSDFLSRAKAQGYEVPQHAFRMAMDNLRNRVNFAADFDRGGEDIAYALMVLAREGAASMGDLRYFADVKTRAFGSPLAAAQLGAALALYGDPTRADLMFAEAVRQLVAQTGGEDKIWRADYGTHLRDAAGVLTLAAEAGSNVVDRKILTERIAKPGHKSTQEALWTLLAANALIDAPSGDGFTVNGAPTTGPLVHVLEDQTAMAPLEIRNATGDEAVLTLTTFGVPKVAPERGGNGYAIDRLYFTMDGAPADIENVAVGTRLVTVLRITPFSSTEARLMVNDPLPAGFEIDNPSLLSSGDVRELDWLKLNAGPESTEFRSDRFLAAVNWRSDKPFELGYIVRAISPGGFHHPAASVEDMYRPEFRAHTDTGRVRIIE